MLRYTLILLIVLLTAPIARAGDIEIVLDRQHYGLQLYLKVPLNLAPDVFGVGRPPVTQMSGVDLSYAATFLDALVVVAPDGPIDLRVTDALLHPATTPIPFHAPWDADSATAFGADVARPTGKADLYVAFDATYAAAPESMTLTFRPDISESTVAVLRAFSMGQIQRELTVDIAATPEIEIQFTAWSPVFKWIFGLGLAGFALSGLLLYRAPPLDA